MFLAFYSQWGCYYLLDIKSYNYKNVQVIMETGHDTI